MKKHLIVMSLITMFGIQSLSSQIRFNNSITNKLVSSSSAFIDASSNTDVNNSTDEGKGLQFPSTNLVSLTALKATGPMGLPSNFPTFYDGLLVYNTATGDSGIGKVAVTPGFYYYSNPGQSFPGGKINAGTWKPMGSGGTASTINITSNTPVNTNYKTASADQEKVIKLTGSANGTTTHIDLGTTNLAANKVKQFRKAMVYDSTGKLVLVSTGDYDVATNKFVTGNGLMNLLLKKGNYNVELYYTAN